mgnify:CR=1 FL=1
MKKIFNEFKAFISKGNVIDLAVGVIIGGAFTAIVNGLTQNVLQPLINWVIALIGGKDALSGAVTVLSGSADDLANAIYINWGAFITAIINFFLVAVVLFFIVKLINKARESAEKVKAMELEKFYEKHPDKRPVVKVETPKQTQEEILAEIRDLLKESK